MKKDIVRIETFKGKRYVVARLNGKILSRKRWNPKNFNLNIAKAQFKQTKSFSDAVIRTKLKNVYEIIDTSDKPKLSRKVIKDGLMKGQRRGGNVFYDVKIQIGKDTIHAHARSDNIRSNKELEQAREQAYRRLIGVIAHRLYPDNYDGVDDAEKTRTRERVSNLLDAKKPNIRTGLVKYADT